MGRAVPEDSRKKTVLVTGAGSGMGLECALVLAERGYEVYGSVLNDEEVAELTDNARHRGVPVRVIQMDLTRHEQIEPAVGSMLVETHRIDALVQFAGLGLRGFFEDLSLEEVRRVYEVNFFGLIALLQAVLPSMREAQAGRLVLTSSVAGRIGSMSLSGYASSKFAVEGLAECLAQEVAPFGIYVSLLEPGLIHTPHFTVNRNRAKRATDPSSIYYPWFCQHEQIVDNILKRNRFTTRDIAEVVVRILRAERPRLRYMVGGKAKLVVGFRRYIPGDVFERLYFRLVRRLVTQPGTQAKGLS